MDHLDGTYLVGTDDEDDENNYVTPNLAGRQVALNLGISRVNVTSRRLANIQRFRQELLPPQPMASTSAAASAAAALAGSSDNAGAATSRLSQTLTRLVNATRNEHRQAQPSAAPATSSQLRYTPEEQSEADDLWQSISIELPTWIWPAPAVDAGFEPVSVWRQPAPAGHMGYALVHGLPLTEWEPAVSCSGVHALVHLSLQRCITDYEKLFNGDERFVGMIDGPMPISSLERLFFALWAARYHSLPKRNPNNHFEARRPNEATADFLSHLLRSTHLPIPDLVNDFFDRVVAGNPAPHFKVGDFRITLLRWYESCPASRRFLEEHVSGPAIMELPNLELYRADIRYQLRDLFREHFADALDMLRLRIYNVRTRRKPMWRLPRDPRPWPSQEEDPAVWRIRPDRILNHENVIFADSWGVHLVPTSNALTIILSGPADSILQKLKKYFLSHRVKNVYWFWGRDGLSDSVHDITPDWYSGLTEHFVRWFPHVRLFVLMPPYTRENDHYWSYRIKRGVLESLRDYCLNATVICDPLDLKLHEYHEQWRIRDGSWQRGYPPWPTDEQDREGNPSAVGLRRRKTYMKEKFGIALWDHEANDSMDTDQQAAGQEEASPGTSGSGTARPTLQPARQSGTPPPILGDAPGLVLINQLRGMFPNPHALETQMLNVGRFLNVLHQLDSPVHTPTWLTVYPALSTVEALNLWGAYKHLCYTTAPQMPDSDAETDPMSETPSSDSPPNPSSGHPSVANAAGGRSPSDQLAEAVRNPSFGHPAVANAAVGRSPSGRLAETAAPGLPRPYCAFCRGHTHWSSDCPASDLQTRWAFVKDNQLCQQCMRTGHVLADCGHSNRRCLHCAARHHAALCPRAPGQVSQPAVTPSLPGLGHSSVANAAGDCSPPDSDSNRTSDISRNPGNGHPSAANAAGGRRPPVTSDTIRTRTTSTERRRGTPRASSRGRAAPRAHDLPWPGQGHDW